MKTIIAIIEQGIDGKFSIYMDNTEDFSFGCIGEGKSVEEAKIDFELALKEVSECSMKMNLPVPKKVNIEYRFDYCSILKYYCKLFTLDGMKNITGISTRKLHSYISGDIIPTKNTFIKVKNSLNKVSEEAETFV